MRDKQLEALIDGLKEEYNDLNPIFILAPTQRCGTTLLQRAVNAGEEAIIYGENFMLCEMMPSMLGGAVNDYGNKVEICRSTMNAFVEGKRNIDATALFPDYDEYCTHVLRQFYETMRYYQQKSKSMGYSHWGFKHQPQDIRGFYNALSFLPNARILVVVRDLLEVAKSMRARWPKQMETKAQMEEFGKRWAVNASRLTKLPKKSMFVQYEKMIERPDYFIDAISEFLDVSIEVGEFSNKVNSHYGKADLLNDKNRNIKDSGKYIEPAKLSEEDEKHLLTHAATLYAQLGYGF